MACMATFPSICTGHDIFPPRFNTSGSTSVLANKIPAFRFLDSWLLHVSPKPKVPPHPARQIMAQPTVLVNFRPVAFVGANILFPPCFSFIALGAPTVFVI